MVAGVRPGLEVTQELLARLGNPQAGLRCLHVAGTNGKGSTCRFAHRLLGGAGLRTGLFTSPHMVCVRERFILGEEAISEADFAAALAVVLPHAEAIGATYFETLAGVAALWYRDQGADAVVLETGLGGRLDSTTAFPAEVCAVSQVGLDHVLLLGDTVEKIWREKIAILRPGKILLTCQTAPHLQAELRELANQRGGRAIFLDAHERFRPQGLPDGAIQEDNLLLATRSVENLLGRQLELSEIERALAGMRWPGRFEHVPGAPEVILDVGHNPDAARGLASLAAPLRPVLLFGTMADKDWRQVLGLLEPACSSVHLVPLDLPRAERPEVIASVFPAAQAYATFESAWLQATEVAIAGGVPLLAAGSFHTVGQAVRRLWAEGRYAFWPQGIEPDPQLPGMG